MRRLLVIFMFCAASLAAQAHYVFAGDSITAAIGACSIGSDSQTWPAQAMPLSWFAGGTRHMAATSGWQVPNLITDYPTRVQPYKPNGSTITTAYLLVFVGTNDARSSSASTIQANLRTYWGMARADGFKVVAFTVPPAGLLVGYEATVNAMNANIRADSAYWDLLVDATDPSAFPDFQSTSADPYKCDGTHFTALGLSTFAARVNAALVAQVPPPGTRTTARATMRATIR